jgi:hypothetical protein
MTWQNTCGMTTQIRTGFYDRIMLLIICIPIIMLKGNNTVHELPAMSVLLPANKKQR